MRVLWQYREQKVQRMEATAYYFDGPTLFFSRWETSGREWFPKSKILHNIEPARDYNIKKTQIVSLCEGYMPQLSCVSGTDAILIYVKSI